MQDLASYGSDDSDSEGGPGPSLSRAGAPAQDTAKQADPAPPLAGRSPAAPTPTLSLNRLKVSSSRTNSPLSGIRLPANVGGASPSTFRAASPVKQGKRRESSASPPPYAAAPIEQDEEQAVRQQPPAAADEDANGSRGRHESGNGNGIGSTSGTLLRVRMDSLAEFGVPPMVAGPCSPSVEAKLANYHHLALTRGLHFNDSLSRSKAFRNPRIYAKLVEFVKVDEKGTNWSKTVWDPQGLPADSSASAISADQKARGEARAVGQTAGSRSQISFTSSASASTSRDDQARIRESMARKSEAVPPHEHREKPRERERDRERDKDRNRDRERGGGGGEKRSRWDTGSGASKRERSKSPRR